MINVIGRDVRNFFLYTTDKNVDMIINTLLSDINTLKTWFDDNYFLMNNE